MAKYIQKIKLADGSNDESGIIVYLIDGERLSRGQAVSLARKTIVKSNKSPYPSVEIVSNGSYEYLRTKKDGTTTDNLLSLPRL